MPTTPYAVRLDDELRVALEQQAKLEDRPAAQLATRAIKAMLEAKEYRRKAIDAALEEARAGQFISKDDLNAWIDRWGSDCELPLPSAKQGSESE